MEKFCNSTQNAYCRLTNYYFETFSLVFIACTLQKNENYYLDIDLAMQSLFISTANVDAAALELLGVIVNQAEFLTNG